MTAQHWVIGMIILVFSSVTNYRIRLPSKRKYLIFLGWCILGVEGVLPLEHNGEGIETDGDLDPEGIYYYVADDATDLSSVVDLEVIKQRTNVPSETTRGFKQSPVGA